MNADDRTPAKGAGLYTPRQSESQDAATPARRAFMPVTQSEDSAAAPTTGATPTSRPAPASSAAQAPVTGATRTAAPSTGSIPQRTAVRPTSAPSGIPTSTQTRTTPTFASTGVATAPPQTVSPQTAPTAPVPTTAAPAAAPTTATGPAPQADQARFAGGTAKLKGFAVRATESFKEGDGLSTPASKGGPRKARVLVSRVDPWSALKIGFLLSIAIGIMSVVAVFVLWNVLNEMGTFVLINDWVVKLFTPENEINIMQFLDQNKVMSAAILLSVVNVVLMTALATIGAFLYNVVSSIVGGVYVTLTDD